MVVCFSVLILVRYERRIWLLFVGQGYDGVIWGVWFRCDVVGWCSVYNFVVISAV